MIPQRPIYCLLPTRILFVLGLLGMFLSCSSPQNPDKEEWEALFNGVDLKGWTPKFTGYDLGVNYKDRFLVKDSLLSVRYASQDSFVGDFGHLFHEKKLSYYRIRATYRFVGEQLRNGPGWAVRNNGLMLQGQDPATMGRDQDFPISLEMQLLGGDGEHERSTANLCTPGTNVFIADTLYTPHCINSSSPTFDGDQWVTVEALVLGDSLIRHIVGDMVVLEYTKPTIGGGSVSGYNESAYREGEPIEEGYLSIQAETAPIDFKSIEVLDLCGCMDVKAKNYKSYYIKADNTKCEY